MRPRDRTEFTVAIICALTLEADAIEALFDEIYDRNGVIYKKQYRDQNTHITGRTGLHHVVLSYMPGIGRGAAASVASGSCSSSLTRMHMCRVVKLLKR